MPEGAPQFVVENPKRIPAREKLNKTIRPLRSVEIGDPDLLEIKSAEQANKDRAEMERLRNQVVKMRPVRQEEPDDTVMEENQFDKTYFASERVKKTMPEGYREADENAPYGYYFGRRILGHDMTVNDSVYIGEGDREAIVIDDKKDAPLREAYRRFIETRRQEALMQIKSKKNILSKAFAAIFNKSNGGELTKEQFLDGIAKSVFDFVRQAMPNNLTLVNELAQNAINMSKSRKTYIGSYLNEKAGVCRHQALLSAYVLEKLINDGYLQGQVSVDRNKVKSRGGHAWARFTDKDGEITIIDAAQNFCGKMEDAGQFRWKYARPEDGHKK
ncbi:MAG: hypothetical protein V1928_03090 [Parcubacteria group bacterium]